MSFPQPAIYYPLNISDKNLNSPVVQLQNWATGKPIYDASMNACDISGGVADYQTGIGSVTFTGINTQYVRMPTFTPGTNGLTFSCWFRSNATGDAGRIFDFGTQTTTTLNYNICLIIYTNFLYFSVFYISTQSYVVTGVNINNNTWNHAAVTLTYVATDSSATANCIIYVNGASAATSSTLYYPSTAIPRTFCYLGKTNYTPDTNWFKGNIDDFRVYQSVLTSGQIAQIYNKDPVINSFIDYTALTLYKPVSTATNVTNVVYALTNSMGTDTFYYWIDPFVTKTRMNINNPVKLSYTYNSGSAQTGAKLYVIAGSQCDITLNGTYLTGVSTIWAATITPATINLNAGNNLFEFFVVNNAGQELFAVYVTNSGGTKLFNTDTGITGWTANFTGFFNQNIPLSAFTRSDSSVTANASVLTTNFTTLTSKYDISNNRALNATNVYTTNMGYNTTNENIMNQFLRPTFGYTSTLTTSLLFMPNRSVIIFSTVGTGTITLSGSGVGSLKAPKYLVVGGGGGGGYDAGGGGGSGGVLQGTTSTLGSNAYTVTVGAGGAGRTNSNLVGVNGSNSVFNTFTATGGGGGGAQRVTTAAGNGGSGGGRAGNGTTTGAAGTGIAGQGFEGGNGTLVDIGSGGGGPGGAGIAGVAGAAGGGGAGILSDITGISQVYGGGGGGGWLSTGRSSGGGNGGRGGADAATGRNGENAIGFGGGGGGAGNTTGGTSSGNGFQGIVILSYAD